VDELTRAESGAISTRDGENEGRTVELRIVPWDTVAMTGDGPERFRRGAFRGVDPSRVTIEAGRHGGPLVGRGLALEERDDAAYLTARIAPTPTGDELLTLTREGVYQDVSVVFVPRTSKRAADGVTERHGVDLRRVAILERGAYPGAEVVAVRAEPDDSEGDEDMGESLDLTPVTDRLDRVEQRMEALAISAATPAAVEPSGIYRFRSAGEFIKAAAEDRDLSRELGRALEDLTTPNNEGVVQPAWLTQVQGIINFGRPTVTAFGVAGLPANGMEVRWPKINTETTDADGLLVAVQEAQKSEIQSGQIQTTYGSANIVTYAGGADISYQLIRRSDPAFLDIWTRYMAKAWATVTEQAFINPLWNDGATYDGAYDIDADTDGAVLLEKLFGASVAVESATGAPAEFVLANSGWFTKLAAKSRIVPAYAGNMSMAAGNATANTLAVSVNGLPIIHCRELDNSISPSGGFLVSNRLAAKWHEDGPFTITAEDVAKLGQNVAIWSLGAPALYITDGLQWIYGAA
jgi:phage head maturation protease